MYQEYINKTNPKIIEMEDECILYSEYNKDIGSNEPCAMPIRVEIYVLPKINT